VPVTDTSVISSKNVSYSINEKSFSTKSPIIFRIFTNEAKGVLRHGKIFEDYFSEYQADMISICLEYAHEQADMIYVYCSCESNPIYGDFFFEISGKILERHCLNEVFQYDTSIERQKRALKVIIEDIEKIEKVCNQYGREMPTEIKLVYDVKKDSLKATYAYENFWSESETKFAQDIGDERFAEIRNKNDIQK
jgi:hypothetical protein